MLEHTINGITILVVLIVITVIQSEQVFGEHTDEILWRAFQILLFNIPLLYVLYANGYLEGLQLW